MDETLDMEVEPIPGPSGSREQQEEPPRRFAEAGDVPANDIHDSLMELAPCTFQCLLTDAGDPRDFHVRPWEMEKFFRPVMKKFTKHYATMKQEEIDLVTPEYRDLYPITGSVPVAVLEKTWVRGFVIEVNFPYTEECTYKVQLIDSGLVKDAVPISKIRRLYMEYLEAWPKLAVNCSFQETPGAGLLLMSIQFDEFFEQVAAANPNCEVEFLKPGYYAPDDIYWNVVVLIKKYAMPKPNEKVDIARLMIMAANDPDFNEDDLYKYYTLF